MSTETEYEKWMAETDRCEARSNDPSLEDLEPLFDAVESYEATVHSLRYEEDADEKLRSLFCAVGTAVGAKLSSQAQEAELAGNAIRGAVLTALGERVQIATAELLGEPRTAKTLA